MAKQVRGARAFKPNDSFGVINNPNLYKNKYREEVDREDEDEVEAGSEDVGTQQEATQQHEGFVETKQEESPEHDYKKRYDDLKKHYDNKLQEWKNEKEALKTTAQQMDLDPSIKLPKSPDELEEFKSKYPDVYAVVQTVATMQAQEQSESLKKELEVIKGREKEMEVQSAYKVLLAAHPDFNDIRNDEKFLLWLDEQPKSISEGITKNNTDSKWAIRVLDLYKADSGLKTKPNKSNASAAEAVRTPSSREVPIDKNANKKIWKVSDIAKLKPWEFERLEKEIDQARAEGRITQ